MLVYIASDTGYTEHVVLAGLSIGYVLSVSGFRRVQNAKIRRGRRFNKNCFFKCFNGCTLLICRPMFGRCVSLTAIDRPEFISTWLYFRSDQCAAMYLKETARKENTFCVDSCNCSWPDNCPTRRYRPFLSWAQTGGRLVCDIIFFVRRLTVRENKIIPPRTLSALYLKLKLNFSKHASPCGVRTFGSCRWTSTDY